MRATEILVLLGLVLPVACRTVPGSPQEPTARATLGVTTSVPPAELATRLGLPETVRQSGRRIETVVPGSAAEAAGLQVGDVLVELDGVVPYSQDDIDDVVAVHRPGERIPATWADPRSGERRREFVRLGSGGPPGGNRLRWQHAGLAHLPDALRQARTEAKKVLVGLSGAET